ncbi:hypothetical protein AURUGA1_01106 [Aurantimicrobium sp. MWH-Uga1]|nr:hypothetical protein AURUGA1_01106 [Aurantimicrobium sp. MWH-Uga1]
MYKLNSDLPLLWRTPTSFQIGTSPAEVVVERVYPGEERFLAALQAGISDASLDAVAEECGLSKEQADSFLSRLSPALGSNAHQSSLRIALDGSGPFVDSLGLILIGMGHRVIRASALTAGKCELAIVVGDFVLEPHRTSDWLRREIPHLPIVLGDRTVDIGPVISPRHPEPQHSPCYHCIELHRQDSDSSWVAIASQLIGVRSPVQNPLVCSEVASMVSRWIRNPERESLRSNQILTLAASTGEIRTREYLLHPDCACQALPRNVIVLDSLHDQYPAVPTTAKAAS